MFSQKRSNLIIHCDTYIDLYDKCNIGCEMCKFNKNIKIVNQNEINFDDFKNKRVLFCYKTDPYVLDDYDLVGKSIKKLHDNNCRIVFLTRKAKMIIKQLDLFNNRDFIGVSISENCTKNSNIEDIILLFKKAKELNINTWLSLEPVLTSQFTNNIIYKIRDYTDFIRIGKDDLLDYDWDNIRKDIKVFDNIYIK